MSNNVTHPEPDITWHVLGAGAMGCLWAAYLSAHMDGSKSGDVQLVLRDRRALQNYPGYITVEHAGHTQQSVIAGHNAGTLTGTVNHLLITTKAQDVVPAIESVAGHITDQTVIVLLQNGLKVQREISERFGSHRVWCISTSHGAWLRAPAHVVHAGIGNAWLGQLNALEPVANDVTDLLNLLPVGPLNIRHDPDIQSRLWQKLAINCAVNALTVIHDCPNGELLSRPEAKSQLMALAEEIMTLLVHIPDAPAMPDLPQQITIVVQQTSANISSTLQDIRRGRSTEIQHLNGYLCELADKHGLSCPLNRQMLMAVQRRESAW